MSTFLYTSRRGQVRAEIEGTTMQLIVGLRQARIYEGPDLIANVKLGPGEKIRERKNRPNVCFTHKMPLVGRTKKCATPDAPLLRGMDPMKCVPGYNRTLAVTRTRPNQNWVLHSVPRPKPTVKLIVATDQGTQVRKETL